MVDAAHGPAGWVGVGTCWPGCGNDAPAAAFRSTDGQSWTVEPLPRAADISLIGIASSSAGYLIAAFDWDEAGGALETFVQVWRSTDARSWDRIGELGLGRCSGTCEFIRGVGLAPSGAMVLGAVSGDDTPATGPYVSDDGLSWASLSPTAFGVAALQVGDVWSTDAEVVLVGRECATCAWIAWSSIDGRTWTRAAEPPAPVLPVVLGTGDRDIGLLTTCGANDDCTTELWSSIEGAPWSKAFEVAGFSMVDIAETEGRFILVGENGGYDYEVVTSVDGVTWVEDEPDPVSDDDCGVHVLAGGPGGVVAGDPECLVFFGEVELR